MEPAAVEFQNKGMYQDLSISKSSNEYAFENYNIRIGATQDTTMLSVTNEKGSKEVALNGVTKTREYNTAECVIETIHETELIYNLKINFEKPVTSDVAITVMLRASRGMRFVTVAKDFTVTFGTKTLIVDDLLKEFDIDREWWNSITQKWYIISDSNLRYDDNYIYRTDYEVEKNGENYPEDVPTSYIEGSKILGTYLGHCVINDTLVLFTKDVPNSTDYIYKVTRSGDDLALTTLYSGTLNFDVEHPIEAIGDFESENLQKVYWVDGLNPNRVINVSDSAVYDNTSNTQFDFIPSVSKFPEVTIEKEFDISGVFKSGVIQYYITYYRKFGSQSAIVYTSPLNYITFSDRGGKEDETINLSFRLTISNLDKTFDHIRVYSAKRTSIEGPLEVNLVGEYQIPTTGTITVVDNNYQQEALDPNVLFYLAGDNFTAKTLTKKDGVLFLGDITLTDEDLDTEEKDTLQKYMKNNISEVFYRTYNNAQITATPSHFIDENGHPVTDEKDAVTELCSSVTITFERAVRSNIIIKGFFYLWNWTGDRWQSVTSQNKMYFIPKGSRVITLTTADNLAEPNYALPNVGGEISSLVEPDLYFIISDEDYVDTNGKVFPTIRDDEFFIYRTDHEIQEEGEDYPSDVPIILVKTEEQKVTSIQECPLITFDYKPLGKNNGAFGDSYQLNNNSRTIKTFKGNEIYRFGIQFQTIKGNWTSVVWIGDGKCDIHPYEDLTDNIIYVPDVKFEWNNVNLIPEVQAILQKYINYRIVRAETSTATRSVLTQGVLNPTMFNYKQRSDGTIFSFPSYITRPQNSDIHWQHMDSVGNNGETYAEMQHIDEVKPPCIEPLGWVENENETNNGIVPNGYILEIQYTWVPVVAGIFSFGLATIGRKFRVRYALSPVYKDESGEFHIFKKGVYEDHDTDVNGKIENHVAVEKYFSSKSNRQLPDNATLGISYNNTTVFSFDGWTNAMYESGFYSPLGIPKMVISDDTHFAAVYRYYAINVDTEDISSDLLKEHLFYIDNNILTLNSPEFYYKDLVISNLAVKVRLVGVTNINEIKNQVLIEATRGKLSTAKQIATTKDVGINPLVSEYLYQDATLKDNSGITSYKMYMWHKTGSIIGQEVLEDSQNDFYSRLEHKIVANYAYGNRTSYFDANVIEYPNSTVSFADDLGSNIQRIKSAYGDVYYASDYDNFVVPDSNNLYPIVTSSDYDTETKYGDGVRIKFNTTPHGVVSLKGEIAEEVPILFQLSAVNKELWSLNSIYDDGTEHSWLNRPKYNWGVGETYVASNKCVAIVYSDWDNNEPRNPDLSTLRTIYRSRLQAAGNGSFVLVCSEKSDLVQADDRKLPKWYYGYLLYNNGEITWVRDKPISTLTGYSGTNRFVWDGTGSYSSLQDEDAKYVYIKSKSLSVDSEKYYSQALVTDVPDTFDANLPYLFIAELYRDIDYTALYGGYTPEALQKVRWLPTSKPTEIGKPVSNFEGDTYYQRFDCLRTYPSTESDENSVVDVVSFMCETHINLDGRDDINRNTTRLTTIRPTNFGLRNPVYDQDNNTFIYNVLDSKFDNDVFNTQIVWSLTKVATSNIDTWTQVNLASTLTLDANYGNLIKLINHSNAIVAFQDKAISVVNFNSKVQLTTEQGVPVELANSGKVDGYDYITTNYGCTNKYSISTSKEGLYFIDSNKKVFATFSKDGIKELSTVGGMSIWFKDNTALGIWKPETTDSNNPFVVTADTNTNDIYVINNATCLVYNELLQAFTSFMYYRGFYLGANLGDKHYYLVKDTDSLKLHEMFGGDYVEDYSITYKVNPEPLIDKTFTNVEYIADMVSTNGTVNDSEILPQTIEKPFEELTTWNEYQRGTENLTKDRRPSNLKQKFRIWRADIPRDRTNKFDRMRNPWIYLKLGTSNNVNKLKMIFHNLIVKYFK